jgi:hypothetical protein
MSLSKRFLSLAAIVAVGACSFAGLARAGDDAPKAPAADAPKPAAETPKADASAPKTPSPMHAVMGWIASQVAPGVENACPSTPEGEKAWRSWFGGGADVNLAGLRDALVAQGWTADRTVSFFQEMAKANAGGCKDCKDCKGEKDCDGGMCGEGKGCCDGDKGACPEGKCPKADGAKGECPGGKCPDADKKPESNPTPAKP